MNILGIETSCDETSAAVVRDGKIISNVVASQIKWHQKHGGVVPELASRMHTEKINRVVAQALTDAEIEFSDLEAIGVTYGPGLEGALLVGYTAAKTIAKICNIPLIPINHLQAHIYAAYTDPIPPQFPYLALIISGGHSIIGKVNDHFDIEILGSTRDDAIGEAFDKVSRVIGLGYPGGPAIEKAAKDGNETAFRFAIPMKNEGYELSFSGLKTAVMTTVKGFTPENVPVHDLAASFQKTIADTLIHKTQFALAESGLTEVVFCGGVSANSYIRNRLRESLEATGARLIVPAFQYCTDNGGMIALTTHYYIQTHPNQVPKVSGVKPNLSLCV